MTPERATQIAAADAAAKANGLPSYSELLNQLRDAAGHLAMAEKSLRSAKWPTEDVYRAQLRAERMVFIIDPVESAFPALPEPMLGAMGAL